MEGNKNQFISFNEKRIFVEYDKSLLTFYTFLIFRVLILLDGLDEVHAVGNLSNICQPAGHPEKPGIPGKGALTTEVSPLQFTQCLLSGSLLPGKIFNLFFIINSAF